MNNAIPPDVQQKAEEYTINYPNCHIGVIRTPADWIVAGRQSNEELQQLFDTHRFAHGLQVVVMWSHPPMVS